MQSRAFRWLLAFAAVAPFAAAAPNITDITVGRVGDDLKMDWTAAGAVDGYRVYLSTDATCGTSTVVYDGTTPSYAAPGVLADVSPAVYRVTTYVGADESAPGPPVYKFGLPLSWTPTTPSLTLVSVPYATPLPTALDLCRDINGVVPSTEPAQMIVRFSPQTQTPMVKYCTSPIALPIFNIVPQEGLAVRPNAAGHSAVFYGRAPFGPWQLDFEAASLDITGTVFNSRWVSLPYDHDYSDLAAVAADFPEAVEIRVYEDSTPACPVSDPLPGRPECFGMLGLTRPDPTSPWTGTNYDLESRRGQALFMAAGIASSWVPRQRCLIKSGGGKPGKVAGAKSTAVGPDVLLRWDAMLEAEGGYSLYRFPAKQDLAGLDPLTDPAYLAVPLMSPTFPIVDPGAMLLPGLDIYRIVARDSQGHPGAH